LDAQADKRCRIGIQASVEMAIGAIQFISDITLGVLLCAYDDFIAHSDLFATLACRNCLRRGWREHGIDFGTIVWILNRSLELRGLYLLCRSPPESGGEETTAEHSFHVLTFSTTGLHMVMFLPPVYGFRDVPAGQVLMPKSIHSGQYPIAPVTRAIVPKTNAAAM
jgi:hypothetical protein